MKVVLTIYSEDNWKKVYQSIASTPALRGWKTLAKSLGICLEDITVIEEENWSIRTKCLKVLIEYILVHTHQDIASVP